MTFTDFDFQVAALEYEMSWNLQASEEALDQFDQRLHYEQFLRARYKLKELRGRVDL